MKCVYCGFEIPDGENFCRNCGRSVRSYPNGNYSQPPPYGYGGAARSDFEKIPKTGDYLKWKLLCLLNLIPGVGSIVYIVLVLVFAFSDSYKARANYFKANIIWCLISAAVFAAGAVLFFLFFFPFAHFVPDMSWEFGCHPALSLTFFFVA